MSPITIHPDFLAAQELIYQPLGLHFHSIIPEKESQEYGACTFVMDGKNIQFRVAKTTPTKNGQFVTLWKRIENGPILPFDMADAVDLFIVSVRTPTHFGHFVFPKELLWHKGYVSKDGKGGKRAMRVYPPWDVPTSVQAQKTQDWQLPYFLDIQRLDKDRAKELFS